MRSSLHLAAKSRGGEGKGGPAVETTRTTEEEGGEEEGGKTAGACARASSIFMCGTHRHLGRRRRRRMVDCGRDTPVLVNEADVDKWCVSPRETYNR